MRNPAISRDGSLPSSKTTPGRQETLYRYFITFSIGAGRCIMGMLLLVTCSARLDPEYMAQTNEELVVMMISFYKHAEKYSS